MPHIEYFVVSESVSVDQTNNAVSLFHIIEEYTIKQFPARIPSLVITTLWDIEPDERDKEFQGLIKLTPPSPDPPISFQFTFRTDPFVPRQRVFLTMRDLTVNNPGEYRFEVFLQETRYASHKIYLLKSESEGDAPGVKPSSAPEKAKKRRPSQTKSASSGPNRGL